MAACDDWRCEYSQVLIFLKGMWEGYEIQPAHRPLINTRRDSQAVMQGISHPGMIHFVSLSSHSPVQNLLPLLFFYFYETEGVLTSFSKGCYSGSVEDRPVKCPFSKSGKRFICSHAPLMILIIMKHTGQENGETSQFLKDHTTLKVEALTGIIYI